VCRNTTDILRSSVGSNTYIFRVRLHILHIAALDFAAYDANVCSIEMILNMAIIPLDIKILIRTCVRNT